MEARQIVPYPYTTAAATLCLVTQSGRILLGWKKRGLGEGLWNGFGGKVEPGETVGAAARRELQEEAGISSRSLELRGKLFFTFDGSLELTEGFVFHTQSYSGEPVETEEMRPRWFSFSEIPYERMWVDDILWLPLFLEGHYFLAYFHLDTKERLSHGRLRTLPAEFFKLSSEHKHS